MDLRKLKTLIDLVSESNVSELEITEAEGKVRIVKSGGAPVMMYLLLLANRWPWKKWLFRPVTPSNPRWWALFTGRPAQAPARLLRWAL